MKKIVTLSAFQFFMWNICAAQNLLLNGSFETNTLSADSSNLTAAWSSIVSDSWEVDGGSMDLITSDACGVPSEGNWFVRTSPQGGIWPYLAFSLKFTDTLVFGHQYTLSFDKMYCGPNSSAIDIGLSDDSTLFGTALHSFTAPSINSWANESYIFQAFSPGPYLTVNVGITGGTGQIALDNFSLSPLANAVNVSVQNGIMVYPNPTENKIELRMKTVSSSEYFYLLDETGRLIRSFPNEGSTSQFLDLSGIPSGLYFLNILQENIKIFKL